MKKISQTKSKKKQRPIQMRRTRQIYELNDRGELDYVEVSSIWEDYMLDLQQNWNEITACIHSYIKDTTERNDIDYKVPDITLYHEKLLKVIKRDRSHHPMFRCYTAAKIMELFTSKKTVYERGRQPSKIDRFNVKFTVFSMGGYQYPDHVFILFLVPNEERLYSYYIFQSYYNSYTTKGKYGFYKLSKKMFQMFTEIIHGFKDYERLFNLQNYFCDQDLDTLLVYKQKLSLFTGVYITSNFNDSRIQDDDPFITDVTKNSYFITEFKDKVNLKIRDIICPINTYFLHYPNLSEPHKEYIIYISDLDSDGKYSEYIGLNIEKNKKIHETPTEPRSGIKYKYIKFNKEVFWPREWSTYVIKNLNLNCDPFTRKIYTLYLSKPQNPQQYDYDFNDVYDDEKKE